MWSYLFVRQPIFISCFLFLSLAACAPEIETVVSVTPPLAEATTIPAATAMRTAAVPTATAAETVTLPAATATRPIATASADEATALPQPTQVVPTPAPDTPSPSPAYLPCPDDQPADSPSPAGLLRVLYTANNQYWLWREETGTAEALPIIRENWPVASPDGRRMAFSRTSSEQERELWVMDSDGRNERKLATLTTAGILERYPDEVFDIGLLGYRWHDNHTIVYGLSPQLLIGGVVKEAVYLVDVESGVSRRVLPPEEYDSGTFRLSPDKVHAVAVTADNFGQTADYFAELHLINVADEQVRLKVPANFLSLGTFSPDSRYVIVTVEDGAIILDTADLSQRPISMPYRGSNVAEGAIAHPPSFWIDETTWYVLIPEGDLFQPGAMITLWHVNLVEGTATLINSYSGIIFSVVVSPDQRRLAFLEDIADGFGNLHLVDVVTGQDVVYDNGRVNLNFDHWLSDSTHFVYHYSDNGSPNQGYRRMGHICQPSVLLEPLIDFVESGWWVDDTRFLISEESKLYLQSLDGERVLIGELSAAPGSFTSYSFYFEES